MGNMPEPAAIGFHNQLTLLRKQARLQDLRNYLGEGVLELDVIEILTPDGPRSLRRHHVIPPQRHRSRLRRPRNATPLQHHHPHGELFPLLATRELGQLMKTEPITPEFLWLNRRAFLASIGATSVAAAATGPISGIKPGPYSLKEEPNPIGHVTTYNNFYEFGVDKRDPAVNAQHFRTDPWKLRIEGEVEKPIDLSLADIYGAGQIEERVYRFRCVEGWSAVIPWAGIPLARFLDKVKPKSTAKFVAFETYFDAGQMPLSRMAGLNFPYIEGLRLDEAMHPLTLMAVGLYGRYLPPQNGAPVRLVVPWKYGFKSIKSIVKIRLTSKQPPTSWNISNPREYGFYSNVNPAVAHPRWSQATERRLGRIAKQPTLPFNGYEKEVADLYRGLDLVKNY
jgi:sulfoxide reductase catalytic subunit YedY